MYQPHPHLHTHPRPRPCYLNSTVRSIKSSLCDPFVPSVTVTRSQPHDSLNLAYSLCFLGVCSNSSHSEHLGVFKAFVLCQLFFPFSFFSNRSTLRNREQIPALNLNLYLFHFLISSLALTSHIFPSHTSSLTLPSLSTLSTTSYIGPKLYLVILIAACVLA